MTKTLSNFVLLALLLTATYLAAQRFAPAWLAETSLYLGNPTQWTAEAKRQHPVDYLRHVEQRLQQQQGTFKQIVADIRQKSAPLEQHIREHSEELAKTSAFLNQGRTVYQQALATANSHSAQVVNFAGRVYPDLPIRINLRAPIY